MAEKAETCRRTITCLYIIVSNYSAVVGIYTVKAKIDQRNMSYYSRISILVDR
jgi:hypothetical protein